VLKFKILFTLALAIYKYIVVDASHH